MNFFFNITYIDKISEIILEMRNENIILTYGDLEFLNDKPLQPAISNYIRKSLRMLKEEHSIVRLSTNDVSLTCIKERGERLYCPLLVTRKAIYTPNDIEDLTVKLEKIKEIIRVFPSHNRFSKGKLTIEKVAV